MNGRNCRHTYESVREGLQTRQSETASVSLLDSTVLIGENQRKLEALARENDWEKNTRK